MPILCLYGDRRIALVAERLKNAGHSVTHVKEGGSAAVCAAMDAAPSLILLPIPTTRDGVHLTGTDCPLACLAEAIPPGVPIFGGGIPPIFGENPVFDLLTEESFALLNADLTAEGVIRLLYERSEKSLTETEVLLLGYGRIASLLLPRLIALGATVYVAARKEEARTRARLLGAKVFSFDMPLPDADFIVNSAPPPFSPKKLPQGLFIDLAGLPAPAENDPLAARFLPAPALPGRLFPESAAKIIYDRVAARLAENQPRLESV